LCNLTGGTAWRINGSRAHAFTDIYNGGVAGHNISGMNLIVENIIMNDGRNGTEYNCVITQVPPLQDIKADPIFLFVAGEYSE